MTDEQQQSTDEQTEQIARNLYEGVRQLNYATARPPGLTYPGTVYTVLGSLAAAAHGLEQSLGQLHQFLGGELDAGRLGHDLGHSPSNEVHKAQEALLDAGAMAKKLGRALEIAQNAINAVNGEPELNAARLANQAFPMSVDEAVRRPVLGEPPERRRTQTRNVQSKREI